MNILATAAARRLRIVSIPLLGAMLLAACQPSGENSASLVIRDARVWTGDPALPWAEAVAVDGETISFVGSNADVGELIGPQTRIITGMGHMLVPGFIDTHVHFVAGGAGLASVQLRDAATKDEFARRIGEFGADIEPGEWILQGAWDHQNWGGELPQREWIDSLTPDNPVWVSRLDGHMALANSRALELAGVDADSPDIAGGEIVRSEDGRPTGVLKDNAMPLVERVVPPPSAALVDRQIAAAMNYVASNGVTTVHDMHDSLGDPDASWKAIAAYRRLHADGKLITRIYSLTPLDDWRRLRDEVAANGRGDDWLRIGGLKGFMDGSLGSHTAAFFEPFTDAPDDNGFLINDLDDMRAWIAGADDAGLHIAVHAIGDRANSALLDIFLDVADAHGPRDRRFRIEHAQHIRPQDIARFAAQDVTASMQPYHAIDDGRWADKVIGAERSKTTYAFRSLVDAGARVAFGSDWFVAPADPIAGIHAAVTRHTLDGAHPGGWVPEQKISVEQALRAYTVDAAFASFEEDKKGAIRAGMLADFALLDRDLTAIPIETIRDTRVVATIVGGELVYEAALDKAH